jgi:hypothetical protein
LQYQLGLVFHLFEIGSHYMFGVDHFAPWNSHFIIKDKLWKLSTQRLLDYMN